MAKEEITVMSKVEPGVRFPPAFSLEGKTAIVTGASRGIGRAVAELFAAAGADVGIIARNRKELEVVADVIRNNRREAYVEACDMRDGESVKRCIDRLPAPHILVNNAGINVPQSFLDVDVDTFDRIFAINVKAAFFVAQKVARRMREKGQQGAIVNVTSQAGHVGLIRRTVYCATKHALEGLTKAMAIELAPDIRVNAVAPTFIETPMTTSFFEEEKFRAYVRSNLLVSSVGTVDDVAAAVLYVVSPAAKLMTGASLVLDGGWTAH